MSQSNKMEQSDDSIEETDDNNPSTSNSKVMLAMSSFGNQDCIFPDLIYAKFWLDIVFKKNVL